jgi:hypothetical protein
MLSTIATDAVPATDLWPAVSGRLNKRARPARALPGRRRLGLALALALVVVAGWTLVRPSLSGDLSTAQAVDLARNDPQVAALLRGDIANVTVTQVVNELATVVVRGGHGQQVVVTVDQRSRIVTRVFQGPQLSAALTQKALSIVHADPRTTALLARGATIGQIVPIEVSYTKAAPSPGQPAEGTETWAQVPLDLDNQEWDAYVDLPQSKIDRLLDPQGTEVPLP